MPKLEQAQKDFQSQRERYQKIRDDLSVKVKLLEENKVRRTERSTAGFKIGTSLIFHLLSAG